MAAEISNCEAQNFKYELSEKNHSVVARLKMKEPQPSETSMNICR